ncbi:hypothetical protein HD593_000522 [Nonomuraea rubra]|uniref:Uncharacterized protein n=1 Tax=Nonomuraea rubra TaxID=46180 RepID=A0A7X0NLL7_9ACTN|nr:hypothetical protein [Nonomuraea rubra]
MTSARPDGSGSPTTIVVGEGKVELDTAVCAQP